ncbi:TRAP transporter small permease [Pontitalea aquivivens]|uniref:TRAP transporter small permease n=1 Tax=Pontitalea aquivivens TaxID=3388663 RepID=UPI003970839E
MTLAERIDRAILWVARALAALGAGAVAVMAALTVAAVFMRYGLGAPFRFTEELGGLMLVCSVFLGMPYVLASHANIRVTLASDRARGPLRRMVWVLGQIVLIAFAAIFFRDALADAQFTQKLNLKTEVARIGLAPFVWVMVAAVGLVGVIGAWQALRPPPEKPEGPHP